MEYIIALDLSLSNSGVAVFSQDGKIKKLLSIATDPSQETPIRLKNIGSKLLKLKKEYKPKVVVIEEGFTRYNISTQQLFKVHGLVNYLFAGTEQIRYYSGTVRKLVTGKGNIKKEEARDYILNKYKNIEFEDLDQSDAFLLGLCYFIDKKIIKGV